MIAFYAFSSARAFAHASSKRASALRHKQRSATVYMLIFQALLFSKCCI